MNSIWFKLFFRSNKKNWLNTLINIGGLTLGLAGLIVVLLYYNKENSYDQWNSNKDIIYKVGHAFSDGQLFDDSTQPEGLKSTEIIPEITDFYRMSSWYSKGLLEVNKSNTIYTKKIVYGTSNFFDFFPHPILEGNSQNMLNSKDDIVISEFVRNKLFKNKKALGQSITIGKEKYIISGVFKLQKPSTTEPDVVIMKPLNKKALLNWGGYSNFTYYKVKEGTDIQSLENKLHQVFVNNSYQKEADKIGITLNEYVKQQGSTPFLEKLNGFRLQSKGDVGPLEGKGSYLFLVIMLGLSILIIIISCINFINLSIASASSRGKEVAIKKILGISSFTLKIQYILEVFIQCFIALVLAFLMLELVLPLFNAYFNTVLTLKNKQIIIQLVILVFFISIFIGVLFAFYMSKFKTIKVLKGNYSRSKNMVLFRNSMLGLQFIISGFFLIGGLIVYCQINYMTSKKLGFSGEQILVVNFANNHKKMERYELVKKIFNKEPNIEAISTSIEVPGENQDISIDLAYKDNIVDTKLVSVDFGHLEMIKTTMKSGRTFSSQFASDSINAIIINETAVKKLGFGQKNPTNEIIKAFGKRLKVIGVVKDYHLEGFDKKIKPVFYMHYLSINWFKYNINSVHFKLRKENIEETITKIEHFWSTELEPGYPLSYEFVNQKFNKNYEYYKRQQSLFTLQTLVVILIALLGLFALTTLTIQQRLKEVAIRKTLGATSKEIVFQLVKVFFKVVLVSSLILIPLTHYFMQNWLDNFAYKIDMPWWPYFVTPIILLMLVLVVVSLKAFNATKIDLIKYLKFE